MPTAFANLADILQFGPISLSEVVRIFTPIAEAVDHAPGRGVLHPRLRPSSIFFDEQRNPSLGDTGLATRGAPEYMSPEEIRGETPDARADVYSLAALAYHALTGRPPFEGVTEQGIMFKQATEPPRPPRELRPDLPEGIDAVLLKGLAKRPDDRYQTATEFARSLSTAAESRRELETTRPEEAAPITASAPPPSSELPKWVAEEEATPADTPPAGPVATLKKRGLNPWLILFILLGLVLRFGINGGSHPASYDYSPTPIPVGLLTRFWNADYSPDGKQIIASLDDMTVRVWDAATITQQAEQLGRGGIREAEFSPDGTRILTTDEDTGSHEYFASVWDARLGTELLRLSGHTAHLFSARYNPQGTQIVTASMDGSARVWDAATGKQQLLLGERGYSILTAHYSPDGKQVALEGAEHHVEIWDATSAKLLISFSACNSVAYSPDSKRMVLVQDNDTASVLDTETWRNLLVLTGHEDAVRGETYSPDGTQIVTRSADRTARIWDAETGKQLAILDGHDREVSAAIYSPDSRYIVTATYGNPAQVWDAKTGVRVTALGDAFDVAVFSPDGKQLFTGGEHGTAHVWDTATWKEVLTWNTKAANAAPQPPQATATAQGALPATQVAPQTRPPLLFPRRKPRRPRKPPGRPGRRWGTRWPPSGRLKRRRPHWPCMRLRPPWRSRWEPNRRLRQRRPIRPAGPSRKRPPAQPRPSR